MELPHNEPLVVGLKPWLPWPLSRWRWWTEPVRAERLAALRIGLAALLLADLLLTYVPRFDEFYGVDSLGAPNLFDFHFEYNSKRQYQRWNWSVLRGPADPLNRIVLAGAWLAATVWVLRGLARRLHPSTQAEEPASLRWGLALWTVGSALALAGLWSQLKVDPNADADIFLTLFSGGMVWVVGCALLALALWKVWRGQPGEQDPFILPLVLVAYTVATLFLVVGVWRVFQESIGPGDFFSFSWVQGRWDGEQVQRWDGDHRFLDMVLVIWIIATVFMLLGFWTRLSVLIVWLLSVSFENMNSYNDNAGDQVRTIALFYLLVSPCGAVWSLDSLWARWWGRRGGYWGRWLGRLDRPVYIHPWMLRLLLIQMAYIYCVNGLYKVFGKEWQEGTSLYFVLNDLTLARWSYAQIRIPLLMTQILSKAVLIWEVCFPLFLLFPWIMAGILLSRPLRCKGSVLAIRILRILRGLALLFGVGFHVGIWASLELGFFGPYMICLYAPLLPWERWLGRRRPQPALQRAG